MSVLKKYILPVIILLITAMLWQIITTNPPQNQRSRTGPVSQMTVEVKTINTEDYQVMVNSFGVVKPHINSSLIAQVGGQITYLNSNLRNGGFFEQGEVLLRVDDRDYQAEVKVAEANLMTAKQSLMEEQARGKQALVDWQRLSDGQSAGDLVLRKPQLAAAQAQVLAAEAQLDKALLQLERTTVVAPFAGRVLALQVDFGQVIFANTVLAKIYAIDLVEVRLPIKNNDLALIDLPEQFRQPSSGKSSIPVILHSDLIGQQSWQGAIVRTEGAIDSQAQQLYVVAQIVDPYQDQALTPIKIGQYITAEITGKLLTDVMVIPNRAIYQGSYVYIVSKGRLQRREIEIFWQNSQEAIISQGLAPGDQLVLTALGQVSSGVAVQVIESKVPQSQLKPLTPQPQYISSPSDKGRYGSNMTGDKL